MPSEAAKKRAAAKKASKGKKKIPVKGGSSTEDAAAAGPAAGAPAISPRTCTGVLGSHPHGRDIQIINFTLTYYGMELFQDTTLELTHGHRYGLIGPNGCGKSTLLTAIGEREIPIPDHIDIFHLVAEIESSEMTALEAVMECDAERIRLEKLAEQLMANPDEMNEEQLTDVYERLESLDAATAEKRAANILHGLGFTHEMMQKQTKDYSGGWRMRIALARALFVRPTLLLLDEPTNHLDLEACVWLEEELKKYNRILVLISHSEDFLNNVCTKIIHLQQGKMSYYSGNYNQFVKTKAELEENQMKMYEKEQNQIADMKEYIARFGHGSAKLARQAQSKEKVLAKMMASGLTEKVVKERNVNFSFPDCGKIPPPVLMVQNVSFAYPDGKVIYDNIDFGMDLDTRLALVGPNGAGKSTLLKLLVGELIPTSGQVRRHGHLRIARFHQHLEDQLDFELNGIEFMQREYPDELKEVDDARRALGRYGLSGKQQVMPIKNLSDGQRVRIIFSWLAHKAPHMLMLDEPTNHLDIETIDALADALRSFNGGVTLVSHDFRLIDKCADVIWVCENQKVTPWEGDILAYKDHLRQKLMEETW